MVHYNYSQSGPMTDPWRVSMHLAMELGGEAESDYQGRMIIFDQDDTIFSVFGELYLCEFLELETFVGLFEKLRMCTFAFF